MMTSNATQTPRTKWRKLAIQMVSGGVVGAGFSLAATMLMDSDVLGTLSLSQEIALLVATMYICIGMMVAIGSALPGAGARLLNFEDEDEVRDQRKAMGWSSASMVLMGVLLAVLALSGPGGVVAPWLALALNLGGWLVVAAASVKLMRNMDELMRSLTRETGEWAYYLLLLVGGGWALLAWLGFTPAMGMLDFLTLNHVLLLLASFIAAGKRGMLAPR